MFFPSTDSLVLVFLKIVRNDYASVFLLKLFLILNVFDGIFVYHLKKIVVRRSKNYLTSSHFLKTKVLSERLFWLTNVEWFAFFLLLQYFISQSLICWFLLAVPTLTLIKKQSYLS